MSEPFMPDVLIGQTSSTGEVDFVKVPIFDVRRGISIETPAVEVTHKGERWYIPRDYGRRLSAKSSQTLAICLATVRATTTKSDTPKPAPSITVNN